MKAVSVKELRNELQMRSPKEVRDICLRLTRFKKENKELMTYILYESSDEESYIESVKLEIDEQFGQANKKSYYLYKKNVSRILRNTRKYIRYSQNKKTEIDLLIYFCAKLKITNPLLQRNSGLSNMYNRLIDIITKKVSSMHEDLQFDYGLEINALGKI